MPWMYVLLLIASAYVLVKVVQGVREFVIWYNEGRAFAAERKRLHALRRQQRDAGLHVPNLKERPADSSKPPAYPHAGGEPKPPAGDSGIKGL